jgi:hypothetical protein
MMTAGERDSLMLAVRRHGAETLLSVFAVALKEKAGTAHEAGRHREAELLMEQAVTLLDTLPTIREIEERLESIKLVRT